MRSFFFFFALFLSSCTTLVIRELGWEDPLPADVVRPKRYLIETRIQDIYKVRSEEKLTAHAAQVLSSDIEKLCPGGHSILSAKYPESKPDPNSFSRWVSVVLTIQCEEASYTAFKKSQTQPESPKSEPSPAVVQTDMEGAELRFLAEKCSQVTKDESAVESCNHALGRVEEYKGRDAARLKSQVYTGLCVAAQKGQGTSSVKKYCSKALGYASDINDIRTELIAAGILCMGTLDGSSCLEAARRADTLRLKNREDRVGFQLYEKGVELLAEECRARVEGACKRLAEASSECLSTPKYCRALRLRFAPILARSVDSSKGSHENGSGERGMDYSRSTQPQNGDVDSELSNLIEDILATSRKPARKR